MGIFRRSHYSNHNYAGKNQINFKEQNNFLLTTFQRTPIYGVVVFCNAQNVVMLVGLSSVLPRKCMLD